MEQLFRGIRKGVHTIIHFTTATATPIGGGGGGGEPAVTVYLHDSGYGS